MPADMVDAAFDTWLPDLPEEARSELIPAYHPGLELFAVQAANPFSSTVPDPLACLQVPPSLVRSKSCLDMLHALLGPDQAELAPPEQTLPHAGSFSDTALADMLLCGPEQTATDYQPQSAFALVRIAGIF